ncbi:hypothetical protein KIPB_016271, partial [Kipferlia bialata]
DKEFVKCVKRKLGAEYYEEWRVNFPAEMSLLMANWEDCKRRFSGVDSETMFIAMPPKMYKKLPEEVEERLSEEQDGFDDAIVLTGADGVRVFDPVVNKVLGLIEEQMRRLREEGSQGARQLHAMLLVGGFSSS